MIQLVSAILYRLDGWGRGDGFLPFKPFSYLRTGGLNNSRLVIGIPIALATHNWWFALSYFVATIIPYGEDSILDKTFGSLKWFVVGALFGGAALSWGNALWLGLLSLSAKWLNIDHALWEFFIIGFCGTLIFVWR